jgi:phosphatidylserine/phosphatidylglycerophosphate/cardiolipin synthase-like enzyme
MKSKLLASILLTCLVAPVSAQPITVNDTCQVYFSPKGGAEQAIIALIGTATKTINVLAYSFTSKPIADALIAAHIHGVVVQVVLDKSNVGLPTRTQADEISVVGIPTYIDSTHAIAHNKVIVVDGRTFETGSFNYSAAAEKSNGENALICPSISAANAYTLDFNKHLSHSARY